MPLLFSIAARRGESRNPRIPGQAGDDGGLGCTPGQVGDDTWVAGDDSWVAGEDKQVVIPAKAGIHEVPSLPGCSVRHPWIPGQAGDDGGWGCTPGQVWDDSYGGYTPGKAGGDKRVAGDDLQVVIPANAGIHDFPDLPGCLIHAVDAR